MAFKWLALCWMLFSSFLTLESRAEDVVRIGWIGPMSGPISKYGSYQSAILAEEDINAEGGINGKKIKLIFEDGKGEGLSAVKAAQKLINVDKVKFVLGGHCSPESLAIAPILEKAKVLMLAAITSSPLLTNSGDYIFRATAVSLRVADMLVPFASKDLGLKKFGVLYEETDYARPPAEHFVNLLRKAWLEPVAVQSYNPGETDFRTVLAMFKVKQIDGLYLGVQAPDSAALIMRQLKVLGIRAQVFGNEITGNSVLSNYDQRENFEGIIYAEPPFNQYAAKTIEFTEHFKKRFKTDSLPFGFWTAESYDIVRLLAKTIAECGEEVDQVRDCLYKVRNYEGVSAPISIDANGDGLRDYVIKRVKDGKGDLVN